MGCACSAHRPIWNYHLFGAVLPSCWTFSCWFVCLRNWVSSLCCFSSICLLLIPPLFGGLTHDSHMTFCSFTWLSKPLFPVRATVPSCSQMPHCSHVRSERRRWSYGSSPGLEQKQSPLHTVDGDLRDLLSKIRWVQLSAHREDASLPGLLLLQIQIQLLQGCTMIHSSVGGAGHLQDLWLCVFHPFLWKQDGIRDFFCLLCRIQNTGSWRNLDLWWLWDWTQESRLLGANFQWPCFGAPCLRVQLTNTGCVILEQSLQKESWQRSISLFDMHIFCTNTLHLQLNDKQEIIEKERTMGCPISFLLKHIFSVSG